MDALVDNTLPCELEFHDSGRDYMQEVVEEYPSCYRHSSTLRSQNICLIESLCDLHK